MTGPQGREEDRPGRHLPRRDVRRVRGRGTVSDRPGVIVDESKSLTEGAILVPGYTADGWMVATFIESGFFDPSKPIKDLLREGAPRPPLQADGQDKAKGINVSYDGLIPKIASRCSARRRLAASPTSRLSWSGPGFQDVRRATAPAERSGRSSKINGLRIATCAPCRSRCRRSGCAASTIRAWRRWSPTCCTSSTRSSRSAWTTSRSTALGHAVGGEAQRTRWSPHRVALTDVTYVFDEPTIGLHPHDIQRMNPAPRAARQGQHRARRRAQAGDDRDRRPCRRPRSRGGHGGGTVCFEGTVEGLKASDTLTAAPRPSDGAQGHGPCADRTS